MEPKVKEHIMNNFTKLLKESTKLVESKQERTKRFNATKKVAEEVAKAFKTKAQGPFDYMAAYESDFSRKQKFTPKDIQDQTGDDAQFVFILDINGANWGIGSSVDPEEEFVIYSYNEDGDSTDEDKSAKIISFIKKNS